MSQNINLISVQPYFKDNDILDRWNYYETVISESISSENDNRTIVTLPEYGLGNQSRDEHIPISNEVFDRIQQFTKNQKITLIAGSYAQKTKDGFLNHLTVWDSKGKLAGEYDKKYLFNFEKNSNMISGTRSGIVHLGSGLTIKLLICSDLWYPEEIRSILNKNIDLIIVSTMAVVPKESLISYGRWLWHSLAITRARENVIPLVVSDWAAQPMRNGEAYTCGASSIIDPSIRWTNSDEYRSAFNQISDGQEGVISSIINLTQVREYRNYRKDVGLLPDE